MPDRLRRTLPVRRPLVPDLPTLSAALALAGIGAVFVLKYGLEVTPWAGPAALAFGIGFVGTVLAARRAADAVPARWVFGLEGFLLAGALALALLSPAENDVARLPALAAWLERLFSGTYPYGLPVRPSGSPGLFLLTAPFWMLGMLRLLPVAGLLVFLAALRRLDTTARFPALVGLALLPSFYYEVIVHSELFFNSALALGSLWVFERARGQGAVALLFAAVLAGLLLSTRLYVGVVYGIYGAFAFRSDWARGAAFAGVTLGVWAAMWVPFAVWDPERFAAFGPFAVQGLYLPRWLAAASAGAALALGWRAPDLSAVVARSGWLLAMLVTFFGLTAVDRAFPVAMFLGFDVAYLALPTPFLLMLLAGRTPRSFTVGAATRSPTSEYFPASGASPLTPDPACSTSLTSPSPSAGRPCSTG